MRVPLQWDSKIGPAFIMGLVGSLGTIATIGVMWGKNQTQIENVQAAVVSINREGGRRDAHMQSQESRLSKVETSVNFIVPAIQRIESKLDAKK